MSFPVAFQSAVFYFVACTPCAKVRHRQKAKVQAKKERVERARLETEQPGLYRHPSPFNTNPYWQEEISMGPSLPKKTASKNSSQRGLASSGAESRAPSMSERTNTGDSRANFTDSLTAMPEEDGLPQGWNSRHGYQREDEELWGDWSSNRFMDAISKARDSAGRLIDSTLGKEKEVTAQERRDFYFVPRNPPVNEYHPPVVSSKPPHREAHQWMLQPPPPAKVMEGKVPVSRAVSSGSKSSGRTLIGDDVQLGRLVQEKMAKEKLKRDGAEPTESELIESLFVSRSNRMSIPRSRSLSFDGGSDECVDGQFDRRRRSRLRPVATLAGYDPDDEGEGGGGGGGEGEGEDEDEDASAPRASQIISQSSVSGHAAQRPKLATILSVDGGESSRSASKRSKRQKSTRSKTVAYGSPVGDDTE